MGRRNRVRFRLQCAAAIVGAITFGATLAWPTWIELVFGVDSDDGSGLLEWTIVVASLAMSIGASILARSEWRRGMMIGHQLVGKRWPGL